MCVNKKGEICLGMIGAGRATELHMNALTRYTGVPLCFKWIAAHRYEQVNMMKERYGFVNSSLDYHDILNLSLIHI